MAPRIQIMEEIQERWNVYVTLSRVTDEERFWRVAFDYNGKKSFEIVQNQTWKTIKNEIKGRDLPVGKVYLIKRK
jgi:hypothetical protein